MNRLRGFDWLAVVFYPLAVVLMEAFWVYPWLVWLGGWPLFSEKRPALSLAAVIIVLAVSLLVTRVMNRQKWPMRSIQGVVIGSGLAVILLVLGAEYRADYGFLSGEWFVYIGQVLGNTFVSANTVVVALPVLLYLWWRGIILGQTTSYFKDIYRSFLLGMVALIALIIIWQISSSSEKFEAPGPGIGLNVIAFFFFGLLAIAVCHLYTMRSSMPKEEAALTSIKRWLPVTLGVVGGMVVISVVVASVFSEEFFASIGHGAGIFFGFLGKIFNYILIPFNYLFDAIYWVLRYLLDLIRNPQPLQPEGSGNMTFFEMPDVTPKDLPVGAVLAIKWVVIVLIAAAVVFILAKAISRFRTQRVREEIEEIHESLWSWRGLKDDLRLLFGLMGKKFQRKRAPAPPKYYMDDDITRRLNIREIYRHLLWEAARSGVARRPHETASEYAGRLERAVPDSGESLGRLTDLYIDVRYGETSPPEQKVDSANSIWRALRGLLRGMRGD
jgi:hypothetical protein